MLALDQVPATAPIWLDSDTPGVIVAGNPRRYRIQDPATATRPPAQRRAILDSMETLTFAARRRLARAGSTQEQMDQNPALVAEEVNKLKADLAKLGITKLSAVTKVHEIVCEELCGLGHATMRGEMIMVSDSEYMNYLKLSGPQGATPPRPAPPVAGAGTDTGTGPAGGGPVAAAKE